MELTLEPGLSAKVEKWSVETGRPAGELVEDAIAGYFNEIEDLRVMLDSRYDDIVSGKVQLVDGAEACRLLKERAAARQRSIA
jgi:predicted DNA-binding protein